MQKTNLKTKISTILIIFALTAMALLVTFPITTAQDIEYSKTTHAYVGAIPNPVGVNQDMLIHVGITDFLRVYYQGWEGLTVTVTRPDGQTETLGPFKTDSTGGTGTIYRPTMVGTYKLQTHFPEQTMDWEPYSGSRVPWDGIVNYEASDSFILEVEVNQEPVQYYPGHSLPSEYWSRPIDAQLWEWSAVAGNWLDDPVGLYAAYNDYAPETAHILWEKDLERGGLAGGMYGLQSYQCGDAYEGKFTSATIIAGVLFYNRFTEAGRGGPDAQGVVAVDLHTGEELWFRNNTRISFGQIFYWDSFNYHATFGYLWETSGRTWNAYDPQTGEWIFTMENVPSGTTVRGPKGEIYRYTVDIRDGWMSLWNSSSAVQPQTHRGGSNDGSWGRQIPRKSSDKIIDALETGIEWNVTIPTNLLGSANAAFFGDIIIGANEPGRSAQAQEIDPIEVWGLSLKPGEEGRLLYQKNWQPPPGDMAFGFAEANAEDGVFILSTKENRAHYGFNLYTGEQIWDTEPQDYLDIFGGRDAYAYGKFFSIGMSGIVYCYDGQTGNLEWTYRAPDHLSEVLWTNQWHIRPLFIADGKIYLGTSEHSPVDPKPRGAAFVAVDIETGNEVFRADGLFRQTDWGGRGIIGDSIIATMDTYDQRIYAIGKGPSETTIEVPQAAIPSGTGVTLLGRVTDISPGTMDYSVASRFPKGVPAVADADMSEWMLYVYKQFERPDAAGVPVKIEIVDPNGEYAWIGTETTDSDGNYGFLWKPTTEGKYTVIATFDGSKSYYGSYAMTYLSVDPATSPSTPITPETPAPLLSTEAAIIGAVSIAAVLGLASFAIIRKRK